MRFRLLSAIGLSATLCTTLYTSSFAQTDSSTTGAPAPSTPASTSVPSSLPSTPASAPAAASTTADTAKAPLQGGVQKVTLTLSNLNTVGLDLKNVLKATDGLYDEVTVQPVTLITEPEVVGRGIVINIPIGTQPIGPVQPARKDRVDLAMSNIRPTVTMFKTTVDEFMNGQKELDLPADIKQDLQPQLDAWVQSVNTLSTQEQQLEQLTASQPYDQPTIASHCTAMQASIKALDQTRRAIYKVLKKHAKELS